MKTVLVLQQVPHEKLGNLESHFRAAGMTWRYIELFREPPSQLDLREAAGLIVLGGAMNVDEVDRYPYLAREVAWIREAVVAELPLLGICLGAQLLAKAMGARVYPNRIKEIGWYTIQLTPDAAEDRLFRGSSAEETVFQWHGDTFDLPPGGVLLARSPQCPHQAFRYGSAAWGLQFHVEMTVEGIECWLHEATNVRELDALDYVDPQAIAEQLPQAFPAMRSLGDRVLARFVALCQTPSS